MQTDFRLIGDVHQHYERYHQLLRKARNTLQIGDFGFDYMTLSGVDARRHRIIGGNHDNYDEVNNWPHFLGDYGVHSVEGFGDLFYVRGALSIDQHIRTEGLDWWRAEELTILQGYDMLDEYRQVKPKFVVTHSCPLSVVPYVTQSTHVIKSRTGQVLEEMFAIHQPDIWIFGHYHQSWEMTMNNTHFRCLNKLECLDF